MGKTIRHWVKGFRPEHNTRPWRYTNKKIWKLKTINVHGKHIKKFMRKDLRHSIRCQNRTRFSHAIYEPLIEKSLQRNIVYKID